jgi:UDP-N-acetylglucosamine 2-epimerase (non-hydrolysing)
MIIPKLDTVCNQILVHTGQNYDPKLSDIFMFELGVRTPDYALGAKGTFGEQAAIIFKELERIISIEKPDKLLVLGDTNSSLGAVVAKRMGVPVYHMEAGNRCFDDRVPEEVNRRIIDHSSDVLMPYTTRSMQNLLQEGIPSYKIYVTGNPIKEVLEHFKYKIENSTVLEDLGLKLHASTMHYFLVTLHRAENVDVREKLLSIMTALNFLSLTHGMPVIVSTHPRTMKLIKEIPPTPNDRIDVRWLEPFGLFDFIKLQRSCTCMLSDSGTTCEEAAIYNIPNVHIRDVTERPETVDCGSNIVSGTDYQDITQATEWAMKRKVWTAPEEYLKTNVSDTVINILMSKPR